jgi:hypothetical protein
MISLALSRLGRHAMDARKQIINLASAPTLLTGIWIVHSTLIGQLFRKTYRL